MKEGDIIEWRGVNKTIRGKVIKDEKGDFVCQLDNGCIFSTQGSPSLKICKTL